MTFPLTVRPGENSFLANPDQAKYFFWGGKPTTAHYYVNKQGVPEDQACTWGTALEGKGNWSPTIFGTSWDDINMNIGFSSLKQNELSKSERLDYDITFTGDAVVSPCKYQKTSNKYCQGEDCWDDKDRGCTVCYVVLSQMIYLTNHLNRLPSDQEVLLLWFCPTMTRT